MNDPEIIDELAKMLAEFDGRIIVNAHPMMVGGWETRGERDRKSYEAEARRFLYLFQAATYLTSATNAAED